MYSSAWLAHPSRLLALVCQESVALPIFRPLAHCLMRWKDRQSCNEVCSQWTGLQRRIVWYNATFVRFNWRRFTPKRIWGHNIQQRNKHTVHILTYLFHWSSQLSGYQLRIRGILGLIQSTGYNPIADIRFFRFKYCHMHKYRSYPRSAIAICTSCISYYVEWRGPLKFHGKLNTFIFSFKILFAFSLFFRTFLWLMFLCHPCYFNVIVFFVRCSHEVSRLL
jgi:hypothetical protein